MVRKTVLVLSSPNVARPSPARAMTVAVQRPPSHHPPPLVALRHVPPCASEGAGRAACTWESFRPTSSGTSSRAFHQPGRPFLIGKVGVIHGCSWLWWGFPGGEGINTCWSRASAQPTSASSPFTRACFWLIWIGWCLILPSQLSLPPSLPPRSKYLAYASLVVWGSLTHSCEKKRSKKQRRKEKIFPFECRVPKNSKER